MLQLHYFAFFVPRKIIIVNFSINTHPLGIYQHSNGPYKYSETSCNVSRLCVCVYYASLKSGIWKIVHFCHSLNTHTQGVENYIFTAIFSPQPWHCIAWFISTKTFSLSHNNYGEFFKLPIVSEDAVCYYITGKTFLSKTRSISAGSFISYADDVVDNRVIIIIYWVLLLHSIHISFC